MRIKNHRNKNQYLLTEDGVWVRNQCNTYVPYIDINPENRNDFDLLLKNEIDNFTLRKQRIDANEYRMRNVVVVSDGHDFKNKQKLLETLDEKITILAVNKTLSKWDVNRRINYYIVNNPYDDCVKFLSSDNHPPCISSVRTNINFTKKYRGDLYFYTPVAGEFFSGRAVNVNYKIDDYRNPICAAINLAQRFQVRKLLLFCCDDSFKDQRAAAIQLDNGLWCYPQQIQAQRIIDANLYWMKSQEDVEIKIGNHSSGPKMNSASYIEEESIKDFFEDNNE